MGIFPLSEEKPTTPQDRPLGCAALECPGPRVSGTTSLNTECLWENIPGRAIEVHLEREWEMPGKKQESQSIQFCVIYTAAAWSMAVSDSEPISGHWTLFWLVCCIPDATSTICNLMHHGG